MNIKTVFIRKRGNKYCVMLEYLDSDSGKYKQKTHVSFTNKKEAEKALVDLKYSINNNKFSRPSEITLVDRCNLYVDGIKKNASPNTIDSYNNCIKNHILPYFRNVKLCEVTPSILQSYINKEYDGYSVGTAKLNVLFIKAVLKESYRLKEIPENICDFVKTPSIIEERDDKIDPYNEIEVQLLIKKIEGHYLELPILLMLTLGLRKTEATGLTWSCVDFKENKISIENILHYKKDDGFILKKPKTKSSRRTLITPIELMNKLKSERIRQNELKLKGLLKNDLDLVCLNTKLKPMHSKNVNNGFNNFCRLNDLRRIKIHDLRHTNATLLIASGTNFKTVSERLGHKDIGITLNKYSHVLEDMDKKASENIGKIMFK